MRKSGIRSPDLKQTKCSNPRKLADARVKSDIEPAELVVALMRMKRTGGPLFPNSVPVVRAFEVSR